MSPLKTFLKKEVGKTKYKQTAYVIVDFKFVGIKGHDSSSRRVRHCWGEGSVRAER
jgi:hypothetical protein